jgi:hypothetical protein
VTTWTLLEDLDGHGIWLGINEVAAISTAKRRELDPKRGMARLAIRFNFVDTRAGSALERTDCLIISYS